MTIQANASQASKNFTRQIFAWLRQVKNDHSLPSSAALLALQLIEHFNQRLGGAAWASCEHLAAAIGMSKATAVSLLHQFEDRAHLKVEWGKQGRGHSNRYWMILKGQQADLFETKKGQRKGQSAARKGQPADLNHLKNHLKASPKGEAIKTDIYPDGAQPSAAPRDDGFDAFWQSYPRKVAVDDARKAYCRVIKSKRATAAELLNGAMQYAAEREGQDDTFTKHPATWLDKGCWKDAPASAPPRKRGYMESLVAGLNHGRDDDDDDDNLIEMRAVS